MPSITIAGAGALGLTTALALARAGCSVTVFDPSATGGNASRVAAGMLAPAFEAVMDPLMARHSDVLMAARNLWADLEANLGIPIDRSGAAALGSPGFLHEVDEKLRRLGLYPTQMPRRTLEAMAPGLSASFEMAVLSREDWRIDPTTTLAALRRGANAAGVRFRDHAAEGLEGADQLIVATGMAQGLASLAPALRYLTPIKGQIIRVRAEASPGLVLRTENGYCAGIEGGYLVGATMELGRDDTAIDPEATSQLRTLGVELFPQVGEGGFVAQAGVRAATPDGLPLVGRTSDQKVLLAVGARRNGWLLAPLVAKIITNCVMEREPGPYSSRFDPMRFG